MPTRILMARAAPARAGGKRVFVDQKRLQTGYILGLQTLGALLDFELNGLAFVEALVPVSLDRREVHENIFTGLALDETITLCCVKPLDRTLLSAHR